MVHFDLSHGDNYNDAQQVDIDMSQIDNFILNKKTTTILIITIAYNKMMTTVIILIII